MRIGGEEEGCVRKYCECRSVTYDGRDGCGAGRLVADAILSLTALAAAASPV